MAYLDLVLLEEAHAPDADVDEDDHAEGEGSPSPDVLLASPLGDDSPRSGVFGLGGYDSDSASGDELLAVPAAADNFG